MKVELNVGRGVGWEALGREIVGGGKESGGRERRVEVEEGGLERGWRKGEREIRKEKREGEASGKLVMEAKRRLAEGRN